MSEIGIIANPHAKLNKRNPARQKLLGYILGAEGRLELTSTLEDLKTVAREFRDKKISILAIDGGDGTVSRTLTAVITEYKGQKLPKIALLRGGTINVLAGNLGISGTPEQLLYRLVERHSLGQTEATRRIKTLKIENNYGFLFANGAAPAYLAEYYKIKSGAIGAAFFAFRIALSRFGLRFGLGGLYKKIIREIPQKVTTPELKGLSHRSLGVFASTIEKIPLGLSFFTKLKEFPHKFECLSFAMSARELIWQLPAIMIKGDKGSKNGKLMCFSSDTLIVETVGQHDYTLDGELFVANSDTLTIELGPEIEFIIA